MKLSMQRHDYPREVVSLKSFAAPRRQRLKAWTRSLRAASYWAFVGVTTCAAFGLCPAAVGGTTEPIYRRRIPKPQIEANLIGDTTHINLINAHLPPYPADPGNLSAYNALFDARAAAAVGNTVGGVGMVVIGPSQVGAYDLLEEKNYRNGQDAPTINIPTQKGLAAMAYVDYFPTSARTDLRDMVSQAIMMARPGWCGTFGPREQGSLDLLGDTDEGNYDLTQMSLMHLAYSYYRELTPEAQEYLITQLLARGRIRRPSKNDTFTSGTSPDDWDLAGCFSIEGLCVKDIGETENHILMILTARYLTNQLLYQRDFAWDHDNRRNGMNGNPALTDLLLELLQRILRDDFSEYNAKSYQEETHWALLNLSTYAYDHEVRLAARMVLDYFAAHIAVSSDDLRRLVPFRRRNENENVSRFQGFMTVSLLEAHFGADPMAPYFALQAGNTRAYEYLTVTRPWDWAIAKGGGELVMEALSAYRLPPSIHDLFVNDPHRRFFQRLHRTPRSNDSEKGGNRNCDNFEIYAGSPSYLITAGGLAATWAIDPTFLGQVIAPGKNAQQLGVAMTTSFMPTGLSAGSETQNEASSLIQFGAFSDVQGEGPGTVANYGVASDFACGFRVSSPLPGWASGDQVGSFLFVNKGSVGGVRRQPSPPGFYLAIYREGDFGFLEAYDTWLHPGLTFEEFKSRVLTAHPNIHLQSNQEIIYRTQSGNAIRFVIWNNTERDNIEKGAKVLGVAYGGNDPADGMGDAGNTVGPFLNGTILSSPADAVVEIRNPFLGTLISLDLSDVRHPRRVSETGEVEVAGYNNEVLVDFAWSGPTEGDFFHPFNTLAAAANAVADGGVIKIVPGTTSETGTFNNGKRMTLVAPLGDVHIGCR